MFLTTLGLLRDKKRKPKRHRDVTSNLQGQKGSFSSSCVFATSPPRTLWLHPDFLLLSDNVRNGVESLKTQQLDLVEKLGDLAGWWDDAAARVCWRKLTDFCSAFCGWHNFAKEQCHKFATLREMRETNIYPRAVEESSKFFRLMGTNHLDMRTTPSLTRVMGSLVVDPWLKGTRIPYNHQLQEDKIIRGKKDPSMVRHTKIVSSPSWDWPIICKKWCFFWQNFTFRTPCWEHMMAF